MSENYLMLNGKRVDLTEEQLEKLGLKVDKGIFDRQNKGDDYYYISNNGMLGVTKEEDFICDYALHDVANYCANKEIMQQRALHEILNRLLWRFSMQNNGDKINYTRSQEKFEIMYDVNEKKYETIISWHSIGFETYFYSKEIAQRAIDEIVLPFIKEHPEFIW